MTEERVYVCKHVEDMPDLEDADAVKGKWHGYNRIKAPLEELLDSQNLKFCAFGRAGWSPVGGTNT